MSLSFRKAAIAATSALALSAPALASPIPLTEPTSTTTYEMSFGPGVHFVSLKELFSVVKGEIVQLKLTETADWAITDVDASKNLDVTFESASVKKIGGDDFLSSLVFDYVATKAGDAWIKIASFGKIEDFDVSISTWEQPCLPPSPVSEPGSATLMGLGLAALGVAVRRNLSRNKDYFPKPDAS